MRTARIVPVAAVVLGLLLFLPAAEAKKKPEASYNAQASYTFKNAEPASAHGLVIALSSPAEVVTDPSTGAAGPFGNVSGNGSSKITLTNPSSPIPGAPPADAPEEGESEEGEAEVGAVVEAEAEEGAVVEAEAGEAGSVHLVFRTYKKKIQVKNWWWLDEKGKRLGAKQKG